MRVYQTVVQQWSIPRKRCLADGHIPAFRHHVTVFTDVSEESIVVIVVVEEWETKQSYSTSEIICRT
jgi:uncharacterized DUF497 family protein